MGMGGALKIIKPTNKIVDFNTTIKGLTKNKTEYNNKWTYLENVRC